MPYKTQNYWFRGVNSFAHPGDLAAGEYAWGENVVNRGGVLQTRPGYKVRASIPGTRLQGLAMFTPRNSSPRLMAAVDGRIYTAEFPAYQFHEVGGLVFDPEAQFVEMKPTVRSAKRNPDGSVALITPTPTLTVTDGANRLGYWDGVNAGHLAQDKIQFGPPVGCLWQEWVGSRLWLSNGNRIFASDLVDPLTFSETTYLAERSAFDLPGDCTGLIKSANENGLLAFTAKDTTAFKSFIHDRAQWQQTPEFQKIIVPGIGCAAGRSLCNAYGETYWMNQAGIITLDGALQSLQTSIMQVIDNAMMRSKRCLSPNLAGVCACAFENYLLMSVPYADIYNAHTWALDRAPVNGQRGQAWQGAWTGVRPVQWVTGNIGGQERCFFASYDKSSLNETYIHIWEAFHESREDEGGQIACQVEFGPVKNDELMAFKHAEIEVVEMLGNVNLQTFFGGLKGAWHQVGNAELQAEKGSIGSVYQPSFTTSSILRAYKPQQRTVKTQEFSAQGAACGAESDHIAGRDKALSLLCEWRGRMGIRELRVEVNTEVAKDQKGHCSPDESAEHNAVTERGVTVTA